MTERAIARPPGPSFRFKLSVLAILMAVVPLGALGLLVGDVNRATLAQANAQLLDAILDNVAAATTGALSDVDRTLVLVAAALDDPPEIRAAVVESALDAGAGLAELGFYDAAGEPVTTVAGATELVRPALPPRLPPALRVPGVVQTGPIAYAGGRPFVLRALTTREEPARSVVALAPLHAIGERAVAITMTQLPAGHIAVLTRDRVAIADSRGEQVGQRVGRESFGVLAGFDDTLPARALYAASDYVRADGTRVVGALRSIEGTPFTVIVELPRDVVYRSLATVRMIVGLAVVGAIVLAIVAGVVLARRMTRPIAALVELARGLGQRRLDRTIRVRSTDELGVLGTALEHAASDLEQSESQIRKEQAIRGDLARYLPASLVEEILARKRSLTLGGVRREISVVFADVVGFTPLAERESAETVVALLNELFTILTEIVFRHGGTVDKFIGDCVMAVWGASEATDDHAERAVAAARDMQRWLQVGNEMWRERFGISIELAIGINSGDAVVGNFGSDVRMEFTAIGDVVNVAARLEAIARPDQILTTAATYALVADHARWISLGAQPILGKALPVELYEVRS